MDITSITNVPTRCLVHWERKRISISHLGLVAVNSPPGLVELIKKTLQRDHGIHYFFGGGALTTFIYTSSIFQPLFWTSIFKLPAHRIRRYQLLKVGRISIPNGKGTAVG